MTIEVPVEEVFACLRGPKTNPEGTPGMKDRMKA